MAPVCFTGEFWEKDEKEAMTKPKRKKKLVFMILRCEVTGVR